MGSWHTDEEWGASYPWLTFLSWISGVHGFAVDIWIAIEFVARNIFKDS